MGEKKLIAFDDEQIEKINEFSEKFKKSFTESVRILVDSGLKSYAPEDSITIVHDGLAEKLAELEEKIEKLSWWTSDDNTSRMGNIETELEEMNKHINVLTAASKLFRGHISNRSIHLQD